MRRNLQCSDLEALSTFREVGAGGFVFLYGCVFRLWWLPVRHVKTKTASKSNEAALGLVGISNRLFIGFDSSQVASPKQRE